MFTRCPTCQTTYRVHPEQLSAAAGLVRCGQCETVFQALDHLFEIKHSPYPPASAAAIESAEAPSPESPIHEEDLIEETSHRDEQTLAAVAEQLTAEEPASQTVEEIEQTEQSIAIHEIPTDTETFATEGKPSSEEEQGNASDELDNILGVVEQLESIELHELSSEHHQAATVIDSKFVGPERPGAKQAKDDEAATVESRVAEPLLPFPEQSPGRPFVTLLKVIIALLLISGLAIQLIYFNRAELAKSPDLRPLLEQGCALLNALIPCDIPLQEDLTRFEILDRDIRSHSSKAGILTVNAIVKNNAPFTQPYPVIKLSFRSLGGEPIAERSFPPSLYLDKNTNINKGMAAGEKIRLSLNIVDPGPEAVNFLFDFTRSAQ